MDSFGDYIYLILIVIAVLSGLFKKKKALKATQTAAPKPKWEDLMRQLQQQEEEKKTPQVHTKIETKPTTPPAPKTQRKEQPMQTPPAPQTATMQEEMTQPDEWNLCSTEDAKRAFVYSEIFNRKYEM